MIRALLAFAALALTAGCGIQGDLTPAPPMWGKPHREYERQQQEEAARRAAEEQQKQQEEQQPQQAPQQSAPQPAPPTQQ